MVTAYDSQEGWLDGEDSSMHICLSSINDELSPEVKNVW